MPNNDTPMDLGYSSSPEPVGMGKMPDKMYPTLHLEWPSDYDLPESGEMTVTFKKTNESKSKRNGKARYTVDLEILTIESIEEGEDGGDDESAEEESGSDALDRYAKEAADKESE